jgi:hypothetical protein
VHASGDQESQSVGHQNLGVGQWHPFLPFEAGTFTFQQLTDARKSCVQKNEPFVDGTGVNLILSAKFYVNFIQFLCKFYVNFM